MKKIIVGTICVLMLTSIVGCGTASKDNGTEQAKSQMVNEISEESKQENMQAILIRDKYETIEEAEEALGFKINRLASLPEGYTLEDIFVIQKDFLSITYRSTEGEIEFRSIKEQDDISGDYNIYSEVSNRDIHGMTVTTKGNQGAIHVVIWQDGEISYSITSDIGISADDVNNMLRQ